MNHRHTHPEVLAKRLRVIRATLQASTLNLDHIDRHGSIEHHVSATAALLEAAMMLEAVIAVHPQEERRAWDRFASSDAARAFVGYAGSLCGNAPQYADMMMVERRARFGGGPPAIETIPPPPASAEEETTR